jgi:hypothetical protein
MVAIITTTEAIAVMTPCDFNVTTVSDSPPPGMEVVVVNQSMEQYVEPVSGNHRNISIYIHPPHHKQQYSYKSNRSKLSNRVGRKNHNIHQPGRTNCTQRFHGK